MNDEQRLEDFVDRVRSKEGLNEERYRRLVTVLDAVKSPDGYDKQGRLKALMFDAKPYEAAPFDTSDNDRICISPFRAPLDRESVQAADGFKVICIFVNDTCDAEIVDRLAELGVELIALRCAGYNNVDLDACRRQGIDVVRVPAYSPYAVAEHTVALMLMLNRKLHIAYQRNRAGYFRLEGLTGFDMRGKNVGVVGTGKIGQCTIDILLGFGCNVLAYDKYPNAEVAARPGVEYVDPQRILAESDIITLHVPLFEDTHHLINTEAIDLMKDGVMLINTSRGGLVDTRALIKGLKSGKVAAAGLDVYEEEAGVFFHDVTDMLTDDVLARLLTFNNVVVTSHQAFLTVEALTNIADTTLANLDEYLQGKRGPELTNSVI